MDLSGIAKNQLVLLVMEHERLDRRLFEMIFANKPYDEIGQLYVRLRKDGILQVEEGRWGLCEEVILFAQPLIKEAKTIMAELTSFLESLFAEQALEVELKVTKLGVFWWGAFTNCYRFNLLDHGGDFFIRGRFSSELVASDEVPISVQVLSLKPPLKPQFGYLEETLLAHMRWAKKMKSIGRGLQG